MRRLKVLILFGLCMAVSACSGSAIFNPSNGRIANPLTVLVDSNTDRAYLINANMKSLYTDGSFMVLDLTSPTAPALIETVSMDSFSGQMYYDSVNQYIYTPNRFTEDMARSNDWLLRVNVNEASADFLNIESFDAVNDPFGVAHDPVTNFLYVTSSTTNNMNYFDLNTTPAMVNINMSQMTSDGYELSYAYSTEVAILNRQAFVTNANGGVFVLNLDKVANPALNPVDYYIYNIHNPIGVTTDGTYAYVTNVEYINEDTVDQLVVIDPVALPPIPENTTMQVTDKYDPGVVFATVLTGNNPQEAATGQGYAYVANMDDNTITMVDTSTMTVVATIPVGTQPFGMAPYAPNGIDEYLYVCNVESNNISIIDIAQRAVVATVQPNP